MRKHLLFLFALCAVCRMAVAQVAFADLDEGKYYYLKSGRITTSSSWFRGYVVSTTGTNLTLRGLSTSDLHSSWGNAANNGYTTALDEATANKACMWGVIKYTDISTGSNYAIIYNASNGRCFKSTAEPTNDLAPMSLVDEVGYYKLELMDTGNGKNKSNSYRLRNVSTVNPNNKLSMAPGQDATKCVCAYSGNDADGGVPLTFIEVPAENPNGTFDPNLKKVVELRDVYGNARTAYGLMEELGTYLDVEQFTALGTTLTTFRSAPTVANATALQTAYSDLVPLHCKNDFNYEIYHYHYGMADGRGMLAYDGSRTNQRPATVGVTYTGYTENGYHNPYDEGVSTLWGLWKDTDGSYYLYNESYASRLMTAAAPSQWSDTPVKLALAANSNQANTIAITGASTTGNGIGISLGYYGTNKDNGDIRQQGNLTDEGLKLMFRIVGKADEDAQNIVKAMLRRAEYPVEYKDYVGGLPTDAVVSGDDRTVGNANAILTAQPLGIDPAKHYRIISVQRNGKAISTADCFAGTDGILNTDARNVLTKTYTVGDFSPLCRFVPTATEGSYNIRMDNAGLCLGAFNSGTCNIPAADEQTAANLSVVTPVAQNGLLHHVWTLRVGTDAAANSYLNAWEGADREGLGTYTLGSPVGDGNKWMIQLVESVPVTLSTAGWTTKCFPFAVNIPEGVRAYYATSIQDSEIYVKELDGVIPAATPVLLNGAAGTPFEFVINSEDNSTNPADNILTGTTLRRTGYTAGDVYGLKITGTEAAFVPANTTAVPANKAVLASGLVPDADPAMEKVLSLNFGEPTGISGTVTIAAEGDDAVFDMGGRRVSRLRHGVVYVKANGQKFILK